MPGTWVKYILLVKTRQSFFVNFSVPPSILALPPNSYIVRLNFSDHIGFLFTHTALLLKVWWRKWLNSTCISSIINILHSHSSIKLSRNHVLNYMSISIIMLLITQYRGIFVFTKNLYLSVLSQWLHNINVCCLLKCHVISMRFCTS